LWAQALAAALTLQAEEGGRPYMEPHSSLLLKCPLSVCAPPLPLDLGPMCFPLPLQENMGMAMVYQIFAAVQEWLTERATQAPGAAVDDSEAAQRRALEAAEAQRAAARAHGTPVTVEAFMAWKRAFDAQVAAERSPAGEASGKAGDAAAAAAGRLSGKQWFLRRQAEGEAAEGDDGSAISDGSDADGLSDYEPGHGGGGSDGEVEGDDEEELGEEDEDDEDFLDDYLANKTAPQS
jgi:hypothetical protein